jgi:hypothetical protein
MLHSGVGQTVFESGVVMLAGGAIAGVTARHCAALQQFHNGVTVARCYPVPESARVSVKVPQRSVTGAV